MQLPLLEYNFMKKQDDFSFLYEFYYIYSIKCGSINSFEFGGNVGGNFGDDNFNYSKKLLQKCPTMQEFINKHIKMMKYIQNYGLQYYINQNHIFMLKNARNYSKCYFSDTFSPKSPPNTSQSLKKTPKMSKLPISTPNPCGDVVGGHCGEKNGQNDNFTLFSKDSTQRPICTKHLAVLPMELFDSFTDELSRMKEFLEYIYSQWYTFESQF
jgi:hypothetical protein